MPYYKQFYTQIIFKIIAKTYKRENEYQSDETPTLVIRAEILLIIITRRHTAAHFLRQTIMLPQERTTLSCCGHLMTMMIISRTAYRSEIRYTMYNEALIKAHTRM